jgi:hypothetical protein
MKKCKTLAESKKMWEQWFREIDKEEKINHAFIVDENFDKLVEQHRQEFKKSLQKHKERAAQLHRNRISEEEDIMNNYSAGKEELYLCEMIKECQCKNLFIEENMLYNNKIGFDLDTVEHMEVDIY